MKKKTKRLLIAAAVLLLLALVLGLGPDLWMAAAGRKSIVTAQEAAAFGADAILVLGAGLQPDGSPSLMLGERICTGVELYAAGAAPKLLMSGDHSRPDHDEVNAMKRYLVNAGVPSEHIFMDHAGFSTYESIVRAKEVFGVRKAILVTQKYHLYRALYIAEHTGVEAIGSGADPRMYAGQTYRTIREWISRDKDLIYCLFRVKPRFLGDPVDMRGDGNATDG